MARRHRKDILIPAALLLLTLAAVVLLTYCVHTVGEARRLDRQHAGLRAELALQSAIELASKKIKDRVRDLEIAPDGSTNPYASLASTSAIISGPLVVNGDSIAWTEARVLTLWTSADGQLPWHVSTRFIAWVASRGKSVDRRLILGDPEHLMAERDVLLRVRRDQVEIVLTGGSEPLLGNTAGSPIAYIAQLQPSDGPPPAPPPAAEAPANAHTNLIWGAVVALGLLLSYVRLNRSRPAEGGPRPTQARSLASWDAPTRMLESADPNRRI